MTIRLSLGLVAATATSWAAVTAEPTKEQLDFFEQKVRPLLADNCFQCHSEEQGKAKGGLTMDTKANLMKGGETGAAVTPGDVEKSLLYKALTYKDDDLQMPPKSKGGKLADAQLAIIADWIKMGAPYPATEAKKTKLTGLNDKARQHWAYQPVTKPAIPVNRNQQWCKTPIDCFILQKLEANGMLPSPDADKETVLRRVSYDLTGLPPTSAEVEAFLADTSPNAYERVVDRLLASPAYGERWGRHWLDTARYSDTIGGERNAARTTEYRYPDAWTYRDYVIRSLNEDKPYTDFVVEQLAADKIPGIQPDDSRLAALGFLTVGERFRNVNDIINDRIDTTSKAFLGLTVACARCHDHMFDPIPTKDYYALHGVFANINEPDDKPLLSSKATDQQRADFTAKYDAQIKDLRNRYLDAVGYYLAEIQRAPAAYFKAAMLNGGRGGKNQEALQARNEMIRKNKLDEQFVQYLQRGMLNNPAVFAPLRAFHEGRGFRGGTAMAGNADMMAQRMEEKMAQNIGGKAAGFARRFGDRMRSGPNKIVQTAIAAKQPKNFDEAVQVYIDLYTQYAAQEKGFISALKNATSTPVPGYEEEGLFEFLRGPFEVAPGSAIDSDYVQDAIAGWPNKMLGRGRFNFGEINLLETSHPGAPAHAMIVQDKQRVNNSPVFIRGESQSRGPIVPRGFLEILSPGHKPVTFSEGSGRLELAKCIATRDNTITARVAVNRIWMHHFGEGFVRTPDDLGVMSEKPTHPELIDWLANYFMDNGWSQKKLHKLIVMSRVYMESSHTRPEYETKDPENRLLWRSNIRRLDFEAMRDSLLVFSGELDKTVGGKPINLTDEPYSYRRTVYGYVDRGNLPELMAHFDFSDPDMPNSKRTSTVVPQQALFLMNSSMAVDVTRKILARPEVNRSPNDLGRIMAIYRVLFQRAPNPREIALGAEFVQNESRLQTETVASVSEKPGPRGPGRFGKGLGGRNDSKFGAIKNEGDRVERKPLTAWETYVQSLLFSNEAAYVN